MCDLRATFVHRYFISQCDTRSLTHAYASLLTIAISIVLDQHEQLLFRLRCVRMT